MKIIDNTEEYTTKQLREMDRKLTRYFKLLTSLEEVVRNQLKNPDVKNPPVPLYLNMNVITEHKKLMGTELEILPVIIVYERWLQTAGDLIMNNIGNYHNKKIVEIIMETLRIVASLRNEFRKEEQD